jgi:hypothetical protein
MGDDAPQEPAQPLVHLGYYSDPSGKALEGSGGADLGSAGDEWGVWALVAYIGAVAALVALLVQYDLTGVSIYLAILAIVVITPLVWGALPSLAIAFPLTGALLMALGVATQTLSFWPREEICLVLFSGGLGIAVLGIRLAWVRYFSPSPIPERETAQAVFHWDS